MRSGTAPRVKSARRALSFALNEIKLSLVCLVAYATARLRSRVRKRRSNSTGTLRIAIDARDLGAAPTQGEGPTGLARYADKLIDGLLASGADLHVTVFTAGAYAKPFGPDRFVNVCAEKRTRFYFLICAALGRGDFDLLHVAYTDNHLFRVLPLALAPTSVVTVHDITPVVWPGYAAGKNVGWYRFILRRACRWADRVLFNSEYTRKDLERFLGKTLPNGDVTYLGVDERFKLSCPDEIRHVLTKYDLPERFILTVGRSAPHKNIPALVPAVANLRASGVDAGLVLIGPADDLGGKEELDLTVAEIDARSWFHWPGYVDDEDLPALYSSARVFALPSLYEGFGLPVIEAMACGTPVVCSNSSCLPEIVGDGALLADATDIDAFALALKRAWQDETLRAELIDRARTRIAEFTWDRMTERTLAAYTNGRDAKRTTIP